MHPDDKIITLYLSYFRAPAGITSLRPAMIGENHECVELITGGGVFFDDGRGDRYYGPGSLFWHIAGEHTIHRYLSDKPYECFVANFLMDGPPRRVASRVTVWDIPSEFMSFCDESLRAYHDDNFNRAILARCIHSRLLLAAYSSEQKNGLPGTPRIIQKAIALIEHSFASDMSVESMATELGVSVPHLHMLFKKYLGESPHQRILARRLQESKTLLTSTDQSMKTLAFQCGFPSIEHFCRLFKQRFAMTPSEYRKKSDPYKALSTPLPPRRTPDSSR